MDNFLVGDELLVDQYNQIFDPCLEPTPLPHNLALRHARSTASRNGRFDYRLRLSTRQAKVQVLFADMFLGRKIVGLPGPTSPVPFNLPSLFWKSLSPDCQLVETEIWDQSGWTGTSRCTPYAGTHRIKRISRFRSLSVDVPEPDAPLLALLGLIQLEPPGHPRLFLVIRFVPPGFHHLVRWSQAFTRTRSLHVYRPRQLVPTSGEALPAELSLGFSTQVLVQTSNSLFVYRRTTDCHVHQRRSRAPVTYLVETLRFGLGIHWSSDYEFRWNSFLVSKAPTVGGDRLPHIR